MRDKDLIGREPRLLDANLIENLLSASIEDGGSGESRPLLAKGAHVTDQTIQAIEAARKFLTDPPSYDQAHVDYVSPIDHARAFAEALVEIVAECRELRERAENAETSLKAPEVHWECQQKLNERDEYLKMAYELLEAIAEPNPLNPHDDSLTGWHTSDASRVRTVGAKLAVHHRWEASRK